MEKTTMILLHNIKYSFEDKTIELNDIDIDHIKKQIENGYNQGELNQMYKGEEIRGWWKIVNNLD